MLIVTDRTPDALDIIEGSTKETQESCKEPEPGLAGVGAITGKSKGFRMSAAFDVCSFFFVLFLSYLFTVSSKENHVFSSSAVLEVTLLALT
jgi:hypothetical protein